MSLLRIICAALLFGCCTVNAVVSMAGLKVSGNVIVNGNNQQIQIRGVDRSGTEYACIQGWGIFDGPNDQTSINAMLSWGINTVRIPLNADCWFGINGANTYGGSTYINAITSYVNLITGNNMAVILDLHWTAPGSTQATAQTPMPDSDHAPAFWTSVANTFKSNNAVIFDLFNEPYPDSNSDTTAAWTCLLNGGTWSGISFPVSGMQTLVTTVRATGATNIIMVAGIQYANNLDQWLNYVPIDPLNQIAASAHLYNFNACKDTSCWNANILPVARKYPVIFGEIGENDCASSFITAVMAWADLYCINYVAWSWNTANCATAPALISNYDGTATGFGAGYKSYIAGKAVTCSSSISAPATPTSAATTTPAATVPATTKPPVTTSPVTTPKVTSAPTTLKVTSPATTTKVTSPPTTTKVTSPPTTTKVTSPPTTTKVTSPPTTTTRTTSAPATTTKVTSTPSTTKAVTSPPATSPPATTTKVTVPTTTSRPTTTGQIIYTDSLVNGWQDYSWATVNFANANPHLGTTGTSISFVLNSYQGLYFHQQTLFPATQYTSFQFYVYSPTNLTASTLLAKLYDASGNIFGTQTITTTNALTAATWVQETIALSSFGVGSASVSGILIQYNGAGSGGTIYVDNVSLL